MAKDRGHRAATVFAKSFLRAARGRAKAMETATVPELRAPPIVPGGLRELDAQEWAKAETIYRTLAHEGEGFEKELWEIIGGQCCFLDVVQ